MNKLLSTKVGKLMEAIKKWRGVP